MRRQFDLSFKQIGSFISKWDFAPIAILSFFFLIFKLTIDDISSLMKAQIYFTMTMSINLYFCLQLKFN